MSEIPLYALTPRGALALHYPQIRKSSYRGTSLIRKHLTPWDHRRTLRVGLLKGLRGWRFLMGEVPLYIFTRRGLHRKSENRFVKQK